MKKPKDSILKLRKLKEIRRKDLERNLLDIQLKGQNHYVFIKENGKAQVVFKDGQWIAEHIRTAILQFNYEVNKTNNMLIKEFEEKYIKEYEKTS
jgi:hypothetical protein